MNESGSGPKGHVLVLSMALALTLMLFLTGCASLSGEANVQIPSATISYARTGTAAPSCVFQSGLGDGKSTWAPVLGPLAACQSTFAYDRPGYGSSSAAVSPRDPCTVASELRTILRAANVPTPYILVGHSIGGLYQYAYAKLFPDEVAALLLLDPTHPDHWPQIEKRAPAVAIVVTTLRRTVFSSAMRGEFDDQAGCAERLRALAPPKVPMLMLVRSRFELIESGSFESIVRDLELGWLDLLPGLTRREVKGAGHYIQKDRPAVVAQEIELLVQQIGRR